MTHEQALAAVRYVLESAAGPVSVVVVDTHGEVIASVAMTGAARDTYLNAERKAYTAARSDAMTTRELAAKVAAAPTELASFDPQFSFFLGGVAALEATAAGSARWVSAACRARPTRNSRSRPCARRGWIRRTRFRQVQGRGGARVSRRRSAGR